MSSSFTSKSNFLICFTGVDGSGKTSHAKILLSFLQENKSSVNYVWAASRPLFLYPFLFFTRTLSYWTAVKKGAWTDPLEKASFKVRERLGKIYLALLFIDYTITVIMKVRLPLMFKQILVCDRYVYDLLMELVLSGFHSNIFAKLILYLTPTPEIVFFVDAPSPVIIQRRPTFTEENIRAKQLVYQKFARIFNFKTIDTHRNFEENQEYIRKESLLVLGIK